MLPCWATLCWDTTTYRCAIMSGLPHKAVWAHRPSTNIQCNVVDDEQHRVWYVICSLVRCAVCVHGGPDDGWFSAVHWAAFAIAPAKGMYPRPHPSCGISTWSTSETLIHCAGGHECHGGGCMARETFQRHVQMRAAVVLALVPCVKVNLVLYTTHKHDSYDSVYDSMLRIGAAVKNGCILYMSTPIDLHHYSAFLCTRQSTHSPHFCASVQPVFHGYVS